MQQPLLLTKKTLKTKTLIVVVGPTAIGKTALAIKIAKHYNTEIISSDSRQFFKEMSIGTAVPSKEELSEVKHHFIQHLSIHDKYSVGDFEREALLKIQELFQNHDHVVMAGGSGLYEKAVTEGLDTFPEVDKKVREELNLRLKTEGLESLQNQLKTLDKVYYDQVDLQNPMRVIRGLEVCLCSGKPFSSFRKSNTSERDFNVVKVGLFSDRKIIYDRINQRVDLMMEWGLLEEVKPLYEYRNLNALQTVGYKELFSYMEGKMTLEQATEEIKKNTRRFAKRQLTWYRKDDSVNWLERF